ncbi:MAG: AAA family ATPase, partial [Gemmatimonadaceae bacterium]
MAELIRTGVRMTLVEEGGSAHILNPTQTFRGSWLGHVHVGTSKATDPYLLPLGKPLALLAYLDCAFRRSASRERMISLIWSEDADSRGRQNLRQTLFYIRQRLGADIIESDGDQLRLIASLNTDRDVFESAVEREAWSEAVAAYGGAFLDGFAAPGSAGMEQWASVERMRLSQLFLGASDALAKELLSTGKAREAVAVARRARDEMRGEQRAWRILLEAQLSARDHLSALAEADALELQLADDGDELEQATKLLVRAVRARSGVVGASNGKASESEVSSTTALARDLIAREHEFSTVINAWDELCADKPGQWIHISAPSGLGKSRLLSDIAARLRAVRATVVEVRASPGERDVSGAFAANIAGVLAGRRGARAISVESAGIIVGLSPSASAYLQSRALDTAMGSDAVRRRALALTELLQCVAHENRLALLLDDLHWADAESRTIVDALLARAKELGLLLVTTARALGDRDFASSPGSMLQLHGF